MVLANTSVKMNVWNMDIDMMDNSSRLGCPHQMLRIGALCSVSRNICCNCAFYIFIFKIWS